LRPSRPHTTGSRRRPGGELSRPSARKSPCLAGFRRMPSRALAHPRDMPARPRDRHRYRVGSPLPHPRPLANVSTAATAGVRNSGAVPRSRHSVAPPVGRTEIAGAVGNVVEIERRSRQDPPATASAEHDVPALDSTEVAEAQSLVRCAITAPIASLRRPPRPHLRRRPMLAVVRGARAPRFASNGVRAIAGRSRPYAGCAAAAMTNRWVDLRS
jgi:hypothetical protein